MTNRSNSFVWLFIYWHQLAAFLPIVSRISIQNPLVATLKREREKKKKKKFLLRFNTCIPKIWLHWKSLEIYVYLGNKIMREFNVLEITIFSSEERFVYSGRKQIGRKFNVLDFIIIESEELGVRNLTKQWYYYGYYQRRPLMFKLEIENNPRSILYSSSIMPISHFIWVVTFFFLYKWNNKKYN